MVEGIPVVFPKVAACHPLDLDAVGQRVAALALQVLALLRGEIGEEVIEVADRVLVMVEGRIVGNIRASDLNSEQLAAIMSQTNASTAEQEMTRTIQ